MEIKVCCIASVDEARCAVELGATALGLVSAMPSGPGPIPDTRIQEIAAAMSGSVDTFLLTSKTDANTIAQQATHAGVSTVQLVAPLEEESLQHLRDLLPTHRLVPVLHVTGPAVLNEVDWMERWADALLLDSGNPSARTPELGGTGRTHNWSISRQIVVHSTVPVLLAGGLTPANVGSAIHEVQPHGVDICSGLRTNGALDPAKLTKFVAEVRSAEEGSSPS